MFDKKDIVLHVSIRVSMYVSIHHIGYYASYGARLAFYTMALAYLALAVEEPIQGETSEVCL
jgi:hypothetical protein